MRIKGEKKKNIVSKTKDNFKPKKLVEENLQVKESKPGKHFSYGKRIGFFTLLFVISFGIANYLLMHSLTFENEKYIKYNEKSSLDYKVNLKDNDYYDTKVLGKDMIYVSSLIDSIDAFFNYDFNIDSKIDMNFTYNIIGKLRITDDEEKNTYLEKDYVLLEDKKLEMQNNNHASIKEKVNIDYNYYNNIASGFKSTYGVSSKSNFIVTLIVTKNSSSSDIKINSDVSTQVINIPLSERSVNIKLDYLDIDNNSSIISESNVLVNNVIYIVISVILLLLSIYFALRAVKLIELMHPKKNAFDKYVGKVLKTYDRLIVESRTIIDFSNYEIIKVNKFEELLDVRDNLKLPINYYVVAPHQKAYFYIVSTNIYLYTVKESDLEKE